MWATSTSYMTREYLMSIERVIVAALSCAMLLLSAACAAQKDSQEIVAHAASAIPSSDTQDWVTYGDHLATFKAISEIRGPAPQEEVDRGEGFRLRQVVIALHEPQWTRPTLVRRVAFPSKMTIEDGGWVFHGKEELPLRIEGQPKIEVGKEYLGVFSYGTLGDNPNWFLLAHVAMINGAAQIPSNSETLRGLAPLSGRSSAQVASALRGVAPDPAARNYMSDDPKTRWDKVCDDNDR